MMSARSDQDMSGGAAACATSPGAPVINSSSVLPAPSVAAAGGAAGASAPVPGTVLSATARAMMAVAPTPAVEWTFWNRVLEVRPYHRVIAGTVRCAAARALPGWRGTSWLKLADVLGYMRQHAFGRACAPIDSSVGCYP
jgi:hypothetical protein